MYVACPIHTTVIFIFLPLILPPDIFSRAFGVSKQVQWEIEMLEWSRPCQINYHLLRARGAENTQGTAGLELTPPSLRMTPGGSIFISAVCCHIQYDAEVHIESFNLPFWKLII